MARACAISRSVAGCIARRRRRGEIWPPPQQQPFDALFPPDTGCCAARAPGIRSASPASTIIRSQLVRSPKIRRKPFVQSSRRNEWVAPFVQYSVDDAQISTAARPRRRRAAAARGLRFGAPAIAFEGYWPKTSCAPRVVHGKATPEKRRAARGERMGVSIIRVAIRVHSF